MGASQEMPNEKIASALMIACPEARELVNPLEKAKDGCYVVQLTVGKAHDNDATVRVFEFPKPDQMRQFEAQLAIKLGTAVMTKIMTADEYNQAFNFKRGE